MKLKELLSNITELTKADRNVQLEKYKKIKKTLKQLKKKGKELEEEISKETDESRKKELISKQKIIAAQRRKGLDLLKELREIKKQS